MTDYFALLKETRRPWLDPESLKKKFLALAAEAHPDRVHNASEPEKRSAQDRYTEINAAYNRLLEPKERLQHLLELELGSRPRDVQSVPAGLMNFFVEVSAACKEAEAFLAERSAVYSPLLKVQLFERGQQCSDKLMALQQKINAWREELTVELKKLDALWESAPAAREDVRKTSNAVSADGRRTVLEQLEELGRLFSYSARWSAQLQERIVQLSF